MTANYTEAGTPVIEFGEEEYRTFLEHEVHSASGLSFEEFVRRYDAGELDEGDPEVSDLAGLLWLGQNGHRTTA
jgi:protein involved in sex pheromone biosynthesis